MYSLAITCFSYKKGYFIFKREYTASDIAEYDITNIADVIASVCIIYGVKKANLKISITEWKVSHIPHIVSKKIVTSYENILALLERAVNEHLAVMQC